MRRGETRAQLLRDVELELLKNKNLIDQLADDVTPDALHKWLIEILQKHARKTFARTNRSVGHLYLAL